MAQIILQDALYSVYILQSLPSKMFERTYWDMLVVLGIDSSPLHILEKQLTIWANIMVKKHNLISVNT